jgi:hypothetical protein
MPLKRGRIVGYDADRMAFKFTMMHEEMIVECEVSSVALDDLSGTKGARPSEREAQFKLCAIRSSASNSFDENGIAKGEVIRIFSKHIRSQ